MIYNKDCLDVLKTMEANSIDSLVTDPPAGISFMGKEWDTFGGSATQAASAKAREPFTVFMTEVMKECLRVLKPGAFGLVWAIPRTSHWTATALEDAGFEIRDVITHIFGSGFPKSMDISKQLDKMAGAEREVVGINPSSRPNSKIKGSKGFDGDLEGEESAGVQNITAPSTLEAIQWQGWGTALKPASEHWILIRKPCSEKTVAANVLKYGTGGINIDASRIGTDAMSSGGSIPDIRANNYENSSGKERLQTEIVIKQGRFPANLILSHNDDCMEVGVKNIGSKTKPTRSDNRVENDNLVYGKGLGVHTPENSYANETVSAFECTEGCAVAELDRQSGISKSSSSIRNNNLPGNGKTHGHMVGIPRPGAANDSGGASRFFYCAKASKSDKGLENTHPTVKSTKLMSYLIKLITPPNGTVLDPFTGSGSTGVAALKDGFKFIGIERDESYVKIAEKRLSSV